MGHVWSLFFMRAVSSSVSASNKGKKLACSPIWGLQAKERALTIHYNWWQGHKFLCLLSDPDIEPSRVSLWNWPSSSPWLSPQTNCGETDFWKLIDCANHEDPRYLSCLCRPRYAGANRISTRVLAIRVAEEMYKMNGSTSLLLWLTSTSFRTCQVAGLLCMDLVHFWGATESYLSFKSVWTVAYNETHLWADKERNVCRTFPGFGVVKPGLERERLLVRNGLANI